MQTSVPRRLHKIVSERESGSAKRCLIANQPRSTFLRTEFPILACQQKRAFSRKIGVSK